MKTAIQKFKLYTRTHYYCNVYYIFTIFLFYFSVVLLLPRFMFSFHQSLLSCSHWRLKYPARILEVWIWFSHLWQDYALWTLGNTIRGKNHMNRKEVHYITLILVYLLMCPSCQFIKDNVTLRFTSYSHLQIFA